MYFLLHSTLVSVSDTKGENRLECQPRHLGIGWETTFQQGDARWLGTLMQSAWVSFLFLPLGASVRGSFVLPTIRPFAVRGGIWNVDRLCGYLDRSTGLHAYGSWHEPAVVKVDAPIGERTDLWSVRDHQNRVSFRVQFLQQPQHGLLVGFVEIARGLIGKNQFGLIDQCARHGHSLLFSAGKLPGKMIHAVTEPDALQFSTGLAFIRCAVKILCEHYIFERGEIRHEMKLLKNKPDFLSAKSRQAGLVEPRKIGAVDDRAARSWRIQAAEDVDQRRLAGARRTHDGDPFPRIHAERHAIERAHVPKLLTKLFNFY